MRDAEEIEEQIEELVKRLRDLGETMRIDENAPVALRQLELEAMIVALKWVLRN